MTNLSKWLILILVIIVICCCASAFYLSIISEPKTGDQLFEEFMLNPKPESVQVIDSFDGNPGLYPDFCLHFTMTSDDFERILSSRKWETVTEAPFIGMECGPRNPTWDFLFPPPLLGENVITYIYRERERDLELLFVNSQKDEAYYYFHDGYIH